MKLRKPAKPSVLLIGTDSLKQQLRATAFRNCEINVHTAETLPDALRLCSATRYDLVLLTSTHQGEGPMRVYDELQKVAPRQRVAVFVGPPRYLRELDGSHEGSEGQGAGSPPPPQIVRPQRSAHARLLFIKRLPATG